MTEPNDLVPLKGIVFDKDGTLFDFNATWGAWAYTMLQQEVPADPDRLSALAETLGFDMQTRRFRPGSIVIAETLDTVAEAMQPYLPDTSHAALVERLIRGAEDVPQVPATRLDLFCDRLKDLGLIIGVATNDGARPAIAHLTRAGIADRFAFIAGYDSGYGAKPGTGQLHGFCEETGLSPDQCAMVGDSLHDLMAGKAAGMRTVGVLTGPAPEAELAPVADIVLPSIAALPDWAVRQL